MSPATLACPRLHFPSSSWGRVLFTSLSLGMQPQGQSALHTMPVLSEPREGQGSGSWCCLPSSVPGRGRWRNRNTSHSASPPCFILFQGRDQQEAALISAGPAGPHTGKACVRVMEAGSSPRRRCSILHSLPGAEAVPLPRTQRAPGFLCALQRACRYGREGI